MNDCRSAIRGAFQKLIEDRDGAVEIRSNISAGEFAGNREQYNRQTGITPRFSMVTLLRIFGTGGIEEER